MHTSKERIFVLEMIICDTSAYIMDQPYFIAYSFMEISIGLKRDRRKNQAPLRSQTR